MWILLIFLEELKIFLGAIQAPKLKLKATGKTLFSTEMFVKDKTAHNKQSRAWTSEGMCLASSPNHTRKHSITRGPWDIL